MKVRVQSLISTWPTKRPGSRSASIDKMLDLPVGASGTQLVVEKCHANFISWMLGYCTLFPHGHKGSSGFPAFWRAAAWCDVLLTHKRCCVRKRIWTSVHHSGGSLKCYTMCEVLQIGRVSQLPFLGTADNRILCQICHFGRS